MRCIEPLDKLGVEVLGTIMMADNPFADRIKKRKDVQVIEVEKGKPIAEEIIKSLKSSKP